MRIFYFDTTFKKGNTTKVIEFTIDAFVLKDAYSIWHNSINSHIKNGWFMCDNYVSRQYGNN